MAVGNHIHQFNVDSVKRSSGRQFVILQLLSILFFGLIAGQVPQQSLVADDTLEGPLYALLNRLQLNQLRAAHVEKILATATDKESQEQLHNTLANLYIAQLDDFIEDKSEFARVSQRLSQLESTVANLGSPKMLFRRFETAFRHGEYLLAQFREDRRRLSDLQSAGTVFRQLSEKFDALQQKCEEQIDSLDKVDGGINSLSNLKADLEIDKLSEISFKAAYYAGWSFFNTGVSTQEALLGKTSFRRSLASFCNFLDIDPTDNVSDWDPVFLELSAPRNSQAFLGVALSYLALGQNSEADECFELLRRSDGSQDIKDQIPFWQIQSLLEFGKIDDAALFAAAYLESDQGLSPMQQGQIALMMIRFSYTFSSGSVNRNKEKLNKLGMLGFKVLAQLRQFELTSKLIEDYKIVLPRPSFYSDWITGNHLYSIAEKSGIATDYQVAATRIQTAIDQSASAKLVDVERCRNQLGWAYYKSEKFVKAAGCFELVFSRLARLDPEIAASAAWLLHDCYLKQADGKPRQVERSLKILDDLVSRFPDSKLAPKARLQMVKLRQTKIDTKDAIERLQAVVDSSPTDNLAKYELCVAYYRAYLEKIGEKKSATDDRALVKESLETIQAYFEKLAPSQKLKLLLIKIDLEQRNTADQAKIASYFSQAFSIKKDATSTNLLGELHYRAFQFAKQKNNTDEANMHLQWLVENGDGTAYQKSVLVTRATQIENELKSADSDAARNQLYAKAIAIYQKLADVTGVNIASIQANKNTRIAVSRLAQLMELTGRSAEATSYMALLVSASPNNSGYLRRYGKLLISQKQFTKAIETWRKLAGGLSKESAGWYEAKYNVFHCLALTDVKAAVAPMQQFSALYPNPPGDWKEKFEALKKQISSQ